MLNSTPLKLCIQIFHETKIRGLNGSISTLFDERMNLNIKLKIVPCRGYLISENVERCCTTVSSDFSFLSSVHLDIHVVHHRDDESMKKKKKKKKDLLASAEIENYRAIFRATPSREDVESSVLEIVMQTK